MNGLRLDKKEYKLQNQNLSADFYLLQLIELHNSVIARVSDIHWTLLTNS